MKGMVGLFDHMQRHRRFVQGSHDMLAALRVFEPMVKMICERQEHRLRPS